MSGITVKIPKAGGVAAIFGKMGDKLPDKLRKATAEARGILIPELTDYPPERPGQKYERTYRLQRAWQRAPAVAGKLRLELSNPTEYASFVQGDQQAWMHVDRWTPASEIAKDHEDEIAALYDAAVAEVTNA